MLTEAENVKDPYVSNVFFKDILSLERKIHASISVAKYLNEPDLQIPLWVSASGVVSNVVVYSKNKALIFWFTNYMFSDSDHRV